MNRHTRLLVLLAFAAASLFPLQLAATPPHDCHEHPRETSPSPDQTHVAHATERHAPDGVPVHAHHGSGGPPEVSQAAEPAAEWQVEGRYLDACRCNAPCPCHFGVGSDYDTCDPTLVFHITEGRSGDVRLDGLTAVVVASAEMARLYIDDRGDLHQRRALEEVARAMTGTLLRQGFQLPADQTVSAHPIRVTLADDRAEVSIPGVLDLSANSLVGGDGTTRIRLQNMNLGPSWMEEAWAGRSEVYRYSDAGGWDYGGRNAYFGRFRAGSGGPAEAGEGLGGR